MKNIQKVLVVFGTRPEAIKMAPLCILLRESENFELTICVSGQHREMLDNALDLFELVPDYDLDIMTSGQDLYDITSRILLGIREVLKEVKPNLVLVHGDTTTALSSALASFYGGYKIGHVEAGLRTHNIHSPFPEEFNRKTISSIAELNFVPTKASRANLISEGVLPEKIWITGNTVIDALFLIIKKIDQDKNLKERISTVLNNALNFNIEKEKFVLITGHRRENFGTGFINICKAIRGLALKNKNIKFIYPVHLNPNVQKPVYELLSDLDNVNLIPPLDYEVFIYLLKFSYLVLTDSGGIQEEAPSIGKPVLVMRDTTERPEAITAGTVKLVGSSTNKIISKVSELLENESIYKEMSKSQNPFGEGDASTQISRAIMEYIEND